VTARRHYAATAIALAVALYGVVGLTASKVREQVSPWRVPEEATSWPTLRRWLCAIAQGALFARVRRVPASFGRRQVAERAATTLAAYAPPPAAAWPIEHQAFAGAVAMA